MGLGQVNGISYSDKKLESTDIIVLGDIPMAGCVNKFEFTALDWGTKLQADTVLAFYDKESRIKVKLMVDKYPDHKTRFFK